MSAKPLQSCLTVCDPMDCSLPSSSVHGDSPGKNTGVGCHLLLQGTFQTQGLNLHLLCLLHWQVGSLPFMPPIRHFKFHMIVPVNCCWSETLKFSGWTSGTFLRLKCSGDFTRTGWFQMPSLLCLAIIWSSWLSSLCLCSRAAWASYMSETVFKQGKLQCTSLHA